MNDIRNKFTEDEILKKTRLFNEFIDYKHSLYKHIRTCECCNMNRANTEFELDGKYYCKRCYLKLTPIDNDDNIPF